MELKWKESRMSSGRTDLDLVRGEDVVGYFRDYKPGHLDWVGFANDWEGQDMSHLSLEEAKALAVAIWSFNK